MSLMSAPGKANRRNQRDFVWPFHTHKHIYIYMYKNVFFPCVTRKNWSLGVEKSWYINNTNCSLTEHIQCCGHRANVTELTPNRTPFSVSLKHNPRSNNKVVKTCRRRLFPYILKHDKNIGILDRQWYISWINHCTIETEIGYHWQPRL